MPFSFRGRYRQVSLKMKAFWRAKLPSTFRQGSCLRQVHFQNLTIYSVLAWAFSNDFYFLLGPANMLILLHHILCLREYTRRQIINKRFHFSMKSLLKVQRDCRSFFHSCCACASISYINKYICKKRVNSLVNDPSKSEVKEVMSCHTLSTKTEQFITFGCWGVTGENTTIFARNYHRVYLCPRRWLNNFNAANFVEQHENSLQ